MKKDIQPNYNQTTITCACGNVLEVGSTKKDLKVEQTNSRKNMVLHKTQNETKGNLLSFFFL